MHADDKPTVLIAAGTRPEAIKVAPLVQLLRADAWCDVKLLATAQHRELLDQVLEFFQLTPDVDLDLMQPGQTLPELTSRLVLSLDKVLGDASPDIVLAQGDTTTVMTTALACYYRKIPFGHIEAGLRTGKKFFPFPEEMNRAMVSHLGDLHFAPTTQARDNLLREGVPEERVSVTGNTVIDALLWTAERAPPCDLLPKDGRRLVLVTAHRRESFGPAFEEICLALRDIVESREVSVVYPVHPNPNVIETTERILSGVPNVTLIKPLAYPQFVAAMKAATLILTDSGGVQEEAPSLGKPILVLRDETERPEGVAAGTARLVGPHRRRIVDKTLELLDNEAAYSEMAQARNPYGDGSASQQIAAAIRQFLEQDKGRA